MLFDDVVDSINRITDLRRIAHNRVIDHSKLDADDLKQAIKTVKPHYLHRETVQDRVEEALYLEPDTDIRVLSRLILTDVMLNTYGFQLEAKKVGQYVKKVEQSVVDESNNIRDLVDLACLNKESTRYKNLDLYNFVLSVAWDSENSKSPDEVNLLRKLRDRLNISEADHRILEAKLGVYPKHANEIHTLDEIEKARRELQRKGLLFSIKLEGIDQQIDIIPEELAKILREILNVELREESYRALMEYRPIRRKDHLTKVLERCGVEISRHDTVETLVDYVIRYVPASKAFSSVSPRYGLNNEQLASWLKEINEHVSGTTEERIQRILQHFDELRPHIHEETDERERWYEFYEELGFRNREVLQRQHVIEKDLEIEAKYEDATKFLFSKKLNHTPLHQEGSNHCDGLVSFGNGYLMWDNKSKETPVRLQDHVRQFNDYMGKMRDKPVRIFLVIGPEFTDSSESDAIQNRAERDFMTDIVLITSKELKNLAEEWSSEKNKKREDPFPLGMLAATGRFNRDRLGKFS